MKTISSLVFMRISFCGAARTVTGSSHLIEVNGFRLLLDCGLYQGHREEAYGKNSHFHFDPATIDAVILSHAHIDHCGNLPTLVKNGFSGQIHATPATVDLAALMLEDCGHIQESDFEFASRHLSKRLPEGPLYTLEEALAVVPHFVAHRYGNEFSPVLGVTVSFFDAGHILGSAIVVLDIVENGEKKRLVFTGDLGRENMPILRDPHRVKHGDFLITESTYGTREHPPITESKPILARVIREAMARGGKIIIPAFSLERTQEIVYDLHLLVRDGEIPAIPVVIDSPLSQRLTEVFKKHPECFDPETGIDFRRTDPFSFGSLRYTTTVEESKALNGVIEPMILISASGMAEAGRIRHHLRHGLPDPRNTILVVGYMAENTLGRRLVERQAFVKIFDEMVPVRAHIEVLGNFSAHADRTDLLGFAKGIDGLSKIFVVHGDPKVEDEFSATLRTETSCAVFAPAEGESIEA